MSDSIRLNGTTVNAADALTLARFYEELTGATATGSSHWAAVSGPNAFITFQQVNDFRPPTWPGTQAPMQLHLDFLVDDLDAAGARAAKAGATLQRSSCSARVRRWPLAAVERLAAGDQK